MEKNESPLLPIKEEDLNEFKEEITSHLKSVNWSPEQQQRKGNEQIDLSFLIHNKAINTDSDDTLSILKNAVRISDDRTILSNSVNFVLNAIRKGYMIGVHVAQLYEQSSRLESLIHRNKEGSLHRSETPEFHEKMETKSAILVFVTAYYIVWEISQHREDEVSSINIDFGGIPEVKINRPTSAIRCALYYYAAYLERSGAVKTDLEFIKITQLYFERLVEEISIRKDSLKFAEFFTNNHYKLEHTEFLIQGFETHFHGAASSISFNSIKMEEIVGNREAKHMFTRFAERLLCHDMEAGKNPMMELGGLPSITMGDGKPGTGKSMLIAATATLLRDRCEQLNMPFLFWPLPENIISTYQGGSAERAIEWFKPMADPNKIIFAPIDDAENNLEERTRQGISAGVREFIGVFLRNTEGAYAINNGNRMISLFTNIPDQIDKAVLSRIQFRTSIDGAKANEDFIDQDYIWWSKYEKLSPGFVDMKKPDGYEFMSDQKAIKTLSDITFDDFQFSQDGVKEIYENALKENDPKSHQFFASFYQEVQKRFPFFSSRDLRNIQKAVDARLIDFDLPSLWWDKPEEFFFKGYDDKLIMLKDLMKESLGGMGFAEMRLREALFYIDTMVRINETGVERNIKEAAKRMYIAEKANELLRSGANVLQ